MSKANNLTDFLTSVAQKIRSLLNNDEKINPQDFDSKIEELYIDGYNKGYGEGEDIGFVDGEQAEYDRFWDAYQEYGNRNVYGSAFAGRGWNRETFKPKYPILFMDSAFAANAMFARFNSTDKGVHNAPVDYVEIASLEIDWSSVKTLVSTFADARISDAGFVDCSSCTSLQATFNGGNLGGRGVQKVLLRVKEATTYPTTFNYNGSLTELFFTEDSVIGENLDISWSNKLIHDSLTSIIGALKKLDDGVTRTLTLNIAFQTNGVLSDAEKQKAINKGWSIAYVQR